MAEAHDRKGAVEEQEPDAFEDASETAPNPTTSGAGTIDANDAPSREELSVHAIHAQPTPTKEFGVRSPQIDGADDGTSTLTNAVPPTRPSQNLDAQNSPANLVRNVASPLPMDSDTVSESGQDQAPKRKLFGWLSRATSNSDKVASRPSPPPLPARQNTSSSASGIQNEEQSTTGRQRNHRGSLQSRFKLVRLREETGVELLDENYIDGVGAHEQEQQRTPTSPIGASADVGAKGPQRSQSNSVSSITQPTLSEILPPGTAAGLATGPASSSEEPVDWDLWQELVYEGPVAVARTSQDELNRAIARGIPSAIRGVVWQVLAQSKSDDLEAVYRDLSARGMNSSRRSSEFKIRPGDISRRELDPTSRRESAPASVTGPHAMKRVHSAASSIHSEASSPASSMLNGAAVSPVTSQEGSNAETPKQRQLDPLMEEKRQLQDQANLQRLEKTIRRDLGARTSFSQFLMSANLQEGLFGICKAYALFDEEVGYAQGMNFIAMPLLFNMPEEEAFCMFVRLMNHYKLRDLFVPEMPGLHLHLYQFERLLEDMEPAVYCHLRRRGVTPNLYATQWFLTLFAYRFPLQLVLRIYDLILSEGLETAILKFGMVLMQKNVRNLLAMKDMAELTTFLKERLFDVYIDTSPSATSMLESGFFGSAGGIDNQVYRADALVQDACAVTVTTEVLKQYAAEWQERVTDEKAKQTAEEALKASNTALTYQNRQLSERLETSDTEHVQVASELVRLKVESHQLADQNESLKMQVSELQTIIQAQPGEVEDKLRQEMDRIMQRNIEVQNENRMLEESCADMEKELVQAKLMHAEKNDELDAMRQKWSAITAMMNGKA